MAKIPPASPKQPAQLTPHQMRLGIDRLRKLIARVQQFEPTTVTDQYNIPHVQQLSAAIDEALVRTFGSESLDYDRYSSASVFDNGPHNYAYEIPITDVHRSLERSKQNNLALLNQAVEVLQERLAEAPQNAQSSEVAPTESYPPSSKVFVVHGRAGIEQDVARFLTQVGLDPVILHEQPNQGRTIIEKFEGHSAVGFAVVLLTPEDVGGSKDGPQHSRARQNVILELGYFIGRLGRERVCALKRGDIELPSDILGIAWETLDDHRGWHMKLAKELHAAGYSIDWNKVMRQ
jgi:predicted nucleotide-binding protein